MRVKGGGDLAYSISARNFSDKFLGVGIRPGPGGDSAPHPGDPNLISSWGGAPVQWSSPRMLDEVYRPMAFHHAIVHGLRFSSLASPQPPFSDLADGFPSIRWSADPRAGGGLFQGVHELPSPGDYSSFDL